MLSPRRWPAHLWVPVIAAALLLVHAAGLSVELVLIAAEGGMDQNWMVPVSPAVDAYRIQVIQGFTVGLIVFGIGMWTAWRASKLEDDRLAGIGRVLLYVIAGLGLLLFCLGLPILGIGW